MAGGVGNLFDEIQSNVSSRPISQLLPLVLQLSLRLGHHDLEKWARLEIKGYFRTNPAASDKEPVPDYRRVRGNWIDPYGHEIHVPSQYGFLNDYKVRNGVAELEHIAGLQTSALVDEVVQELLYENFQVRPSCFSLTGASVKGILEAIRTELIDRLNSVRECVEGSDGGLVDYKGEGAPLTEARNRRVFVVYGRNETARRSLFGFLRCLGLHPMEWSELVGLTEKPTPYIGDVLKAGFSAAQAAVVLMTPDDEARLRQPYRESGDATYEFELTPQPRANVLFEAGMAMGLFPERTVVVTLGTIRRFSDLEGLHVVRLDQSVEKRQSLAMRLRTAGCPVNLDGTEWHSTGDFSSPE